MKRNCVVLVFVLLLSIFVASDAKSSGFFGGGGGSSGISTLNTLTGATQTFATGTSGNDFAISSSGTAHTFNIPTASTTNRGLLSSADWDTFNAKIGLGANTFTGAQTMANGLISAPSLKWAHGMGFYYKDANTTAFSNGTKDVYHLTVYPGSGVTTKIGEALDGTSGTEQYLYLYAGATERNEIVMLRGGAAKANLGLYAGTVFTDFAILGPSSEGYLAFDSTNKQLHMRAGTGAVTAGSTTEMAAVGGLVVTTNITAIGNVGAGVDNLMGLAMPAASLGVDGQFVEIHGFGTFAANGNNKEVVLKFGATTLCSSGVVTINNGSWDIKATVTRTAATTQIASCQVHLSNATIVQTYSTPAETLSGAITAQFTGEATSNDDISQKYGVIKWSGVDYY